MRAVCTDWKKVSKPSGANPWERQCGPFKASIMLWQTRPDLWSGVISRRGKHITHIYGKTLAQAKKAATQAMQRRRK